jgi:hypothetical protein
LDLSARGVGVGIVRHTSAPGAESGYPIQRGAGQGSTALDSPPAERVKDRLRSPAKPGRFGGAQGNQKICPTRKRAARAASKQKDQVE